MNRFRFRSARLFFSALIVFVPAIAPGAYVLEAQTFQVPARWTAWETEGRVYGFLGTGAGLAFELDARRRRTWFDTGITAAGSIVPGFHQVEVLFGMGYSPRMFRFGAALGAETYSETLFPSDLERPQGAEDKEQFSGLLGEISLGRAWSSHLDVSVYLRGSSRGAGGGIAVDIWYPCSRQWEVLVNVDISSFARSGLNLDGLAAMAYRTGAASRLGFGLVFAGTDVGIGFFAVMGIEY